MRPIYDRDGDVITPRVEADPAVLKLAEAAHEATLAYVRAPVGEIASPMNSYFALVADDPSVQIVNAAQSWYVRRLSATVPALSGLPILSASAPFKCGGRGGPDYYTDVPAGPIAIKHVADLYRLSQRLARRARDRRDHCANGWSARRASIAASIRTRASASRCSTAPSPPIISTSSTA